jgi:ceramide glucosyltransferase
MHLFAYIVLGVAVFGTLTSTISFLLAVAGAIQFRRHALREQEEVEKLTNLPPVTVLKPVHGKEVRLKESLESFFRQDYPKFEVIFAADEADDAALPVVREVCAEFPNIPTRIMITGKPPWPNAQNYCYHKMTDVAAYDILITSDSDVEVAPNYLRDVIAPLLDPKNGAVTCVFRGKAAGGVWSEVDAIGQSVEFTAGVVTANMMEGMKFGLGPTVVVRKDSLAKIGGFAAAREYLSNDFVIGNFIAAAGYTVVLSGHVVDHISPPMTFKKMWERQMRWAMGTRYSRPKGHFGSGLTFATPFGILGLIAGIALGYTKLGIALFAITVLSRMIECWLLGWWTARDKNARGIWVLVYPLRDLHGFIIWLASYLGTPKRLWRDTNYVLLKGGRLVAKRADGSVLTPN